MQINLQRFRPPQSNQKRKGWISKYQPQRIDEIEIGISEWNIKVNEDRDTAN